MSKHHWLLALGVFLGLLGVAGMVMHLAAPSIMRFAVILDPKVEKSHLLFLLGHYAGTRASMACSLGLLLGALLAVCQACRRAKTAEPPPP